MGKVTFFALTASTLVAVAVLTVLANTWTEMTFLDGRHLATIGMITASFAAVNEGIHALARRVVTR